MTERELEIVKQGLNLCILHTHTCVVADVCDRCPYYQASPHAANCKESLLTDAAKAIIGLEELNVVSAPIAKGKWNAWYRPHNGEYIEYSCSLCGRPSDVREKYCPNCGAPMEEPETVPKGV